MKDSFTFNWQKTGSAEVCNPWLFIINSLHEEHTSCQFASV